MAAPYEYADLFRISILLKQRISGGNLGRRKHEDKNGVALRVCVRKHKDQNRVASGS